MKIETEIFYGQKPLEKFLNKIGWDRVLQVCMNNQQILVIYKAECEE